MFCYITISHKIAFVFLLLLLASPAQSDPPTEAWASRYNGPGNSDDSAAALVLDDDGNIFVTGGSFDGFTNSDCATIKYNSNGEEEWVVRHNGLGDASDSGRDIALDAVGNVYVTGSDACVGPNYWDCFTIAYDNSGDTIWDSYYNGPANSTDKAGAIALDTAGNIYVTGMSYSGSYHDLTTIKYNSAGVQQWAVSPTRSSYSGEGNAIVVDDSGYVYVTGYYPGTNGFPDYVTIKYDTNGEEQWIASYNGSGNQNDIAYDIILDESGNVYVTGFSKSSTVNEFVTIKYSSDGVEQWAASYIKPGSSSNAAFAITLDETGNIYVTGGSGGGVSSDIVTVKYNTDGIEQWVSNYNGSGNASDSPYDITLDEAGNVYVAGTTTGSSTANDIVTIQYNPSGVEQWAVTYNGPANGDDFAYDMALDSSGNIFVTGKSDGFNTGSDYVTIKYAQSSGIEIAEVKIDNQINLQVYPNPSFTSATITIFSTESSICAVHIYSLDGRQIKTLYNGAIHSGENVFSWDRSEIPDGVYILRATTGSWEESEKIVLVR